MPPEVTTLASFHIPLQDILEGEYEIQHTFIDEATEGVVRDKSPDSTSSKKVG